MSEVVGAGEVVTVVAEVEVTPLLHGENLSLSPPWSNRQPTSLLVGFGNEMVAVYSPDAA